ncbi:MAG TPA: response regulator [Terracidiphilus sp.]|nr:response regulator [Terracidiphilus sp.]
MTEAMLFLFSKMPPPPMWAGLAESNKERREGRLRVLIVDDEQLITDSICAILNENGFDATGAYNGLEAIAAARKEHPDIVLSDVLMPRMSGVELGIHLRHEFPNIKIYLFSGQAATTAIIHRAEVEGHHFELFPKPIHPDELMTRLKGL